MEKILRDLGSALQIHYVRQGSLFFTSHELLLQKLETIDLADLMNDSGSSSASNSAIVANCRLLISRFPQVKVKHCYRESNSVADALACQGSKLASDFLYFSSPPPWLFNCYVSDLYGLFHSRLCPGPVVSASLFQFNAFSSLPKKKTIDHIL